MSALWMSFLGQSGLAADAVNFGDSVAELAAARDGSVVAPLPDLGLIRLSGPDSASFLHNLLTNDVSGLDSGMTRFAGMCTPKGRLIATFYIWKEGDDLLVVLSRDILAPVLKKLSMYVLRSKVKLTDISDERVLIGVSAHQGVLGDLDSDVPVRGQKEISGGSLIRLDASRCMLALDAEAAMTLWPTLVTKTKPVGLNAWHWLEIAAGQPRVVAATQEVFVPQMLNMELPDVGGVSFTKGCYPGQEIVARTQYLGKIKRRMYRVSFGATQIALPGMPVFAPETGDQQCGTVVLAASAPGGMSEALICVQSSAAKAGELRLGTPEGTALRPLPLPYALPADGEQ